MQKPIFHIRTKLSLLTEKLGPPFADTADRVGPINGDEQNGTSRVTCRWVVTGEGVALQTDKEVKALEARGEPTFRIQDWESGNGAPRHEYPWRLEGCADDAAAAALVAKLGVELPIGKGGPHFAIGKMGGALMLEMHNRKGVPGPTLMTVGAACRHLSSAELWQIYNTHGAPRSMHRRSNVSLDERRMAAQFIGMAWIASTEDYDAVGIRIAESKPRKRVRTE